MTINFRWWPICAVVLFLVAASSAAAASFSADMVNTKDENIETGKFYLSGRFYRMDTSEDGISVAVIADRQNNVHRILNMDEKVFFEISSDNFRVLSKDPFKLSEYLFSKYDSRVEGSEKINGILCEKQVIPSQNFVIWYSKDLDFPIKIASYAEEKLRYSTELKNIEQTGMPAALFKTPADFSQMEEPGTAEKRKKAEERKKEEGLPGLTSVGRDTIPCRVKIAAGGELRVPIDTRREAYLWVTNETNDRSVYTVSEYKNGRLREGFQPKSSVLEGKGRYKGWEFNDDFWRDTPSRLADEIRVSVEKGLIYAYLRQKGADRTDIYNQGNIQTDGAVDPERALTLKITGNNPFGDETKGKFWLRYASGKSAEAIPFTVENGKTATWQYPAGKGINTVAVSISMGEGQAKISLIQPPADQKEVSEISTVKKSPKTQYTPKPKTINAFTVTHPSGAGKPLTPGKDLGITVTGVTDDASGTIKLYNNRGKGKQIDELKFKLKTDQTKTFAVPGEKNVGWASVWVHKGSFEVRLDQSPNAESIVARKNDPPSAAPAAAPAPGAPSHAASPEAAAGTDAVFGGEVPLMAGAKVTKEVSLGTITQIDLSIPKSAETVIRYYQKAMAGKGWQIGVTTVQGAQGMMQLQKGGRLLTMKAKEEGKNTILNLVLMNK